MIFLGIDPGSTRIGYGIVDVQGSSFKPVAYGVIENDGTDPRADLKTTHGAIRELVRTHAPEAVAVERLFFAANRTTAMSVGQTRGVILFALEQMGLPVYELTPMQVKRYVTGYGKAAKNQVERMTARILGITSTIRPDDAADALALAICASLCHKPVQNS